MKTINPFQKNLSLFIFFLVFFLTVPSSEAALQPLQRTILALYQPQIEESPEVTDIHFNAEMPLNHLGLKVVYRSILDPLPTETEMQDVRGIMTWFKNENTVPSAHNYCRWLQRQFDAGRKLVMFGEMGFHNSDKKKIRALSAECARVLSTFGLSYHGEYSENTYFFEVESLDSEMVEFEHKLSLAEVHKYRLIRTTDPQAKVYLKIKRTDIEDSSSSLVVTTPRGGYVHSSYIVSHNKYFEKKHWRINPFLFFKEAFQTHDIPKPDTTTINGKRIFYSHIDGDGIFNVSNIDRKSFSGEIMLDEVLKHYKDLPITVSLITGYFDMPEYKSERVEKLYYNLFNLSNVEPASHGYAHPLNWKKGTVALKISKYKYSPQKEIQGSIQMIRQLLVKLKINKKINLMLWTGNCAPTPDQLKLSEDFKLLNMNGGDTRFDNTYDSYIYVMPLGIKKDALYQIYSSNSNEYTYTNNWEGPYYGFYNLYKTFQRTETPRRVKPINIYYHFYSAESIAALTALKNGYEFAIKEDIFAIRASEYPPIVKDFYDMQIYKLGDSSFRIEHSGQIKTIRFDQEERHVDIKASQGVIGFDHFQGNLYVHLDNATTQKIQLSADEPQQPYIIKASFFISDFKADSQNISFKKRGWLRSDLVMGGLSANTWYEITSPTETFKLKTNDKGKLEVNFKQPENEKDETPVTLTRIDV